MIAELKRYTEHQPDVNDTIFDNILNLQNFVVSKAANLSSVIGYRRELQIIYLSEHLYNDWITISTMMMLHAIIFLSCPNILLKPYFYNNVFYSYS